MDKFPQIKAADLSFIEVHFETKIKTKIKISKRVGYVL